MGRVHEPALLFEAGGQFSNPSCGEAQFVRYCGLRLGPGRIDEIPLPLVIKFDNDEPQQVSCLIRDKLL